MGERYARWFARIRPLGLAFCGLVLAFPLLLSIAGARLVGFWTLQGLAITAAVDVPTVLLALWLWRPVKFAWVYRPLQVAVVVIALGWFLTWLGGHWGRVSVIAGMVPLWLVFQSLVNLVQGPPSVEETPPRP
jgi:hypothetical protein